MALVFERANASMSRGWNNSRNCVFGFGAVVINSFSVIVVKVLLAIHVLTVNVPDTGESAPYSTILAPSMAVAIVAGIPYAVVVRCAALMDSVVVDAVLVAEVTFPVGAMKVVS